MKLKNNQTLTMQDCKQIEFNKFYRKYYINNEVVDHVEYAFSYDEIETIVTTIANTIDRK